MTFTRYYTGRWHEPITAVTCSRETEKSVWVMERQWSLRGRQDQPPVERRRERKPDFHDTWEAARDYLLGRARDKVTYAEVTLENARKNLALIEAMTPPYTIAACAADYAAAPSGVASTSAECSEQVRQESVSEALPNEEHGK
jgi:hypothetical protein